MATGPLTSSWTASYQRLASPDCEATGCPDYQGEPGRSQECHVQRDQLTACYGMGVHQCVSGDPACWHGDGCGAFVDEP